MDNEEIKYETHKVTVLKFNKESIIKKKAEQGWELYEAEDGMLKTTLHFRKPVKPINRKLIAASGVLVAVLAVSTLIAGISENKETEEVSTTTSVSATPTQSPTPTPTVTKSPSATPTAAKSPSPSPTPSATPSPTPTPTPTPTPEPTPAPVEETQEVVVEQEEEFVEQAPPVVEEAPQETYAPQNFYQAPPVEAPVEQPAPVQEVAPVQQEPAPVMGGFSSCAEARAAGAAPLHLGTPGYNPSLDRDKDGVACE